MMEADMLFSGLLDMSLCTILSEIASSCLNEDRVVALALIDPSFDPEWPNLIL